MELFSSPLATLACLRQVGYLTTDAIATTICLAGNLNRPIMLEGPAGAGKTQLAQSVCDATGMKMIRMQCYQGINDKQAIGDYNKALQDLYTNLQSKTNAVDWSVIRREVMSRDFFSTGPLLEAMESKERCCLLIDELDKVDYAFEAMLLEILSVWEMSIPGMGTVRTRNPPFTVITSNAERELGYALRRRCFYLEIDHPTAKLEAEIVAKKTPTLSAAIHRMVGALGKVMRTQQLEKPPSISEMADFARALQLLDIETIEAKHVDVLLPMIAKTQRDRHSLLLEGTFASIIKQAVKHAEVMRLEEEAQAVETALYAIKDPVSFVPEDRDVSAGHGPESHLSRVPESSVSDTRFSVGDDLQFANHEFNPVLHHAQSVLGVPVQ